MFWKFSFGDYFKWNHYFFFFLKLVLNLTFLLVSQFICSAQFSHSVMFSSLRPHELQHARPPCPSPTPRVYPNSCPLSWWCHLTISSFVDRFSSCPQSFPISGSFQISQLFASGGQNIGVSASTSVLPVNTQDWYPLGWTGWLCYKVPNSEWFKMTQIYFLTVLEA